MKRHIFPIILLMAALVFFILSLCLGEERNILFNIITFALPMLAAVIEIIIAVSSDKIMKEELKKRPIAVPISDIEIDQIFPQDTSGESEEDEI